MQVEGIDRVKSSPSKNIYCVHCNARIFKGMWWTHATGLIRCDPEKTGKPYGLEATPK
jgi:hypothetical protein